MFDKDKWKAEHGKVEEAESEIDQFFAACFLTPSGQKVLEYLRQQTLFKVAKLGSPIEYQADYNGERRIVAERFWRTKRGKEAT